MVRIIRQGVDASCCLLGLYSVFVQVTVLNRLNPAVVSLRVAGLFATGNLRYIINTEVRGVSTQRDETALFIPLYSFAAE